MEKFKQLTSLNAIDPFDTVLGPVVRERVAVAKTVPPSPSCLRVSDIAGINERGRADDEAVDVEVETPLATEPEARPASHPDPYYLARVNGRAMRISRDRFVAWYALAARLVQFDYRALNTLLGVPSWASAREWFQGATREGQIKMFGALDRHMAALRGKASVETGDAAPVAQTAMVGDMSQLEARVTAIRPEMVMLYGANTGRAVTTITDKDLCDAVRDALNRKVTYGALRALLRDQFGNVALRDIPPWRRSEFVTALNALARVTPGVPS